MGLEQIGLEGVFKTAAFTSGLKTYTSGLSSAASKTLSVMGPIGGAISGVLTVGAAAFSALGVAAVAAAGVVAGAITKMVFDASTMADKFSAMSGVTGISTTRLQELAYAGKLLDVELETMTSGLRFLTRNLYAARDGTGEQAEAFDTLGVAVLDSHGELRDADIVFGETIDALGLMTNETERDAIAMKLMGRSAMELNPLINAGSAALAEFSAEAHLMGAVVSEEDIAALDTFRDRMDAMKLSISATAATIAMEFLPVFEDFQNGARTAFGELVQMVKDSRGDLSLLAVRVSNLLTKMIRNVTKSIPKFTRAAIKIIKDVSKSIIKNAPKLIKAGGELLTALIKGFAEAFPEMVKAGIAVTKTLYDSLVKALPSILEAGGELMVALGQGIRDAFAELPSIEEILSAIFGLGVNLTQRFLDWVEKIDWEKLSTDLANGIAAIDWSAKGAQLRKMVDNLLKALLVVFRKVKWLEVGKSMATGFADFWVGFFSGDPGATFKTRIIDVFTGASYQLQLAVWEMGWREVGKAILAQIFNDSDWNTWMKDIKLRFEEMNTGIANDFSIWLKDIWNEIGIASGVGMDYLLLKLQEMWNDFVTLSAAAGKRTMDAFSESWKTVWVNFKTWVLEQVNGLVSAILQIFSRLPGVNLPSVPGGRGTILPYQQPAPTPVPNLTGGGMGRDTGTFGVAKTVSNVVNVYNPAPEMASTSVSRELKRLSFLGSAA